MKKEIYSHPKIPLSMKKEKRKINLYTFIGSFSLMLTNMGGTIAWIGLYVTGKFTQWWVFVIITLCIITSLLMANMFVQSTRKLFYLKK